jgi:ABC-type dipeptide/oligopeptide/nickel transport system permease component
MAKADTIIIELRPEIFSCRIPAMWMYFFKRLMHGIPVLLTVATLTFGIMHMVPGGPFDTEKKLPPEIIANIEAKYHLDKPVWQQYLLYMKQILQGDMGPSYKYIGRDVSDIILEAFPVSLTLGLPLWGFLCRVSCWGRYSFSCSRINGTCYLQHCGKVRSMC